MSQPATVRTLLAATTLAAIAFLATAATAGPPLICHPVEIGDAQSLPWGDKPFKKSGRYDTDDLAADTVRILDRSSSAMVHMETLRRAVLYVGRDIDDANALLAVLMARALDDEAAGKLDAFAWLDAGYAVQCFVQNGVKLADAPGAGPGTAAGIAGYAWVRRATELRPEDPEVQFAAAMVTALADGPEHEQHVGMVLKLAGNDSLVARNLQKHRTHHWPHFQDRRG